ncbi:TRAM, LAG1 and CLN8 (TLC) lipid-sensing domain containing protein, partial [Thalictrum thalictroides]
MDLEKLIGRVTKNEKELWFMCVMVGILMCNIVYRVTGLVSLTFFDCYAKLTKLQKMEWNNRGFSTFHAFVAAGGALYLLIWSDLFGEGSLDEPLSNRKSVLSDSMLGISIGYFLSDMGMILWYYPVLGGLEYLLHHVLSVFSIILSLISGQGQIYILMVLFTESTTPFVNLR